MDLKKYLAQRRDTFVQQARDVIDFSIFDFNHVPEKPLVRAEAKLIVDAFVRYEETGIPANLVIFGARGSGKTLTVKYLDRLFTDDSTLKILYANVRYYSTSFKILAHLLRVSARGTSLAELYTRFQQRFSSRTVVILDEVHLWAPKERQRELLYFLSRDSRNYQVIMLSNDPRFLGEIDPSVRSSLQPELVHFRNYNAPEIAHILDERAHRGLRHPDPSITAYIAALTVKDTNADVRVAIKALFYWVTGEGHEVDVCFEYARRDIYVDLVNDLSDTNLLILKAATVLQKENRFARKVFAAYRELARGLGEVDCSYVHFNNQLSYMQSLGLILLLSTKVDRTYASKISILCREDVIGQVYALRFET